MNKIKHVLVAIAAFVTVPVFAEDQPKDELPGVDISIVEVSNYVWRGYDVHQSYFDQQGKSISGYNAASAFQPSITFQTPVDGLSVNLWGSFAEVGRADVDADKRYQTGPGGDNLFINNGQIDPAGLTTAIDACNMDILGCIVSNNVPGKYKEANGLRRVDELDFTFDYSWDSSLGPVSAGIVAYYWPNRASAQGSVPTEFYISYSPAFYTDLKVKGYFDILTNNQYYNLGWGHSFEFSKVLSLDLGAGAGYGVLRSTNKQGLMDLTGNLGLSVNPGFGKISVGAYLTHRPNLYMYDTGTSKLPAWMVGDNGYDGKVADPGKQYGGMNDFTSSYITSLMATGTNYTGNTQRLPRNLIWYSLAYSFSI